MSIPLKITVDASLNGTAQLPTLPYVDYGPRLTATTWSLTAFAALFLGLRLFSKLWRKRPLWWDDHILIASWVCSFISNRA